MNEKQRKEALKELEELQARADALEKMLKEKPWEPSGGGFYVDGWGEVVDDISDNLTRLFGNEYETKEEAEKAYYQMKYQNWIRKLALELNKGWEPDWCDDHEKYFVFFDHNESSKMWRIYMWKRHNSPETAYFKDRETAEKAIEIIKTWDWVEL